MMCIFSIIYFFIVFANDDDYSMNGKHTSATADKKINDGVKFAYKSKLMNL